MRVDTSRWKKNDIVAYVEIVKPQPIETLGRLLRWYIIVTESRRERRALETIEALGLTVYWPRLHRRTPGGRRRSREIEVSMFPSRILVLMPGTDEAYWRVKWSRGVVDFMRMSDGQHLASLPDHEVEEVRRMEAKKDSKYRNLMLKAEKSPFWPRRKVWAEIFPGRKMLGRIIDQDGQGRVNVDLEEEVLGRKVWAVKPHLIQFAADDETPAPSRREKKLGKVTPERVLADA